MRILIESSINSFGESLLAYSAVPVVKDKYPYAHITLGCGILETGLFRMAKGIDNVVLNSTYGNKANWTQYELIITGHFGTDDKSDLKDVVGDLDSPQYWLDKGDERKLNFTFNEEYHKFFSQRYSERLDSNKKIIGIYYSIPKPTDGEQWELLHLHPQKYDLILKRLNMLRNDVQYVFFTGLNERGSIKVADDNVIVFGPMDNINMLMLFDRLDILVGVASSYTSIFSYFSDVDKIILSSIKENGDYLLGSPDEQIIPHPRLKYLTHYFNKDSYVSYVYPESYASGIKVDMEIDGGKREIFARSLNGVDESEIANKINEVLNNDR